MNIKIILIIILFEIINLFKNKNNGKIKRYDKRLKNFNV